jgi:hypothetical protein
MVIVSSVRVPTGIDSHYDRDLIRGKVLRREVARKGGRYAIECGAGTYDLDPLAIESDKNHKRGD